MAAKNLPSKQKATGLANIKSILIVFLVGTGMAVYTAYHSFKPVRTILKKLMQFGFNPYKQKDISAFLHSSIENMHKENLNTGTQLKQYQKMI